MLNCQEFEVGDVVLAPQGMESPGVSGIGCSMVAGQAGWLPLAEQSVEVVVRPSDHCEIASWVGRCLNAPSSLRGHFRWYAWLSLCRPAFDRENPVRHDGLLVQIPAFLQLFQCTMNLRRRAWSGRKGLSLPVPR